MEIIKKKTFWAGLGAVISGASGYFTGSMDIAEAAQLAFTGLIGIFIRQGLIKGQ